MPRTQRLIVASLALVLGIGFGLFLAGLINFDRLEQPAHDATMMMSPDLLPSEREFKVAIETVMRIEEGHPEGGFTPELLMQAFPGLVADDFKGAGAVVGYYDVQNGVLVYSNTEVVDGAAGDLSDEGYQTLRTNVYRRLNLDPAREPVSVLQILKTPPTPPTTPEIPPATDAGTVCPLDAKLCPDGSSVGRVGPDCEFAACTEKEVVTCRPDQRMVDVCTEQYEPVCAAYQVQCITAPCNPVPKTYGNSCMACMDKNVISYTAGECTID